MINPQCAHEKAVSLLSHTGQGEDAVESNTSSPPDSDLPSGGLTAMVRLRLFFHLGTPQSTLHES